ncbi:MAG: hypothetical protein US51_C0046G0003 [Microgenomates group bacterium GW2011_GWA2_37_6]|nr:MAG: hypothetical protein US51_C0046G0003 [Microgenomates group bacterium GW2011_GWA2_37_6]
MDHMRKLLILSSFFLVTPLLIIITAIYLSFLSYQKNSDGKVLGESTQGIAYAALPPADNTIVNTIDEQDSKTSTLCKKIIAYSNNCWGWGIYGSKVTKFSNYPEAIETITKTLSTKYREKGLVTPFEIAKLYNPRNTNNWIENVTHIMNSLK